MNFDRLLFALWRMAALRLVERVQIERIRRQRAEQRASDIEHVAMHVQQRNQKLERRIMELEGKKTLNECKPIDK